MASFPGKVSHGLLEWSCGIAVLSVTVSPCCRVSGMRLAASPLLGSW